MKYGFGEWLANMKDACPRGETASPSRRLCASVPASGGNGPYLTRDSPFIGAVDALGKYVFPAAVRDFHGPWGCNNPGLGDSAGGIVRKIDDLEYIIVSLRNSIDWYFG